MTGPSVETELTDTIRVVIAHELRTAESEARDRPTVRRLGLNSMMALSIRREIEQVVGLELSATMLWNHPTIATLAAYLAEKLVPQTKYWSTTSTSRPTPTGSVFDALFDRVESTATTGAETGSDDDSTFSRISGMSEPQRAALAEEFDKTSRIAVAEPVAVVGIGCRFPGMFWAGELLAVVGRRGGCDRRGACGSVGCGGVLRSGSAGAGTDDDEVRWFRLGCGGF